MYKTRICMVACSLTLAQTTHSMLKQFTKAWLLTKPNTVLLHTARSVTTLSPEAIADGKLKIKELRRKRDYVEQSYAHLGALLSVRMKHPEYAAYQTQIDNVMYQIREHCQKIGKKDWWNPNE